MELDKKMFDRLTGVSREEHKQLMDMFKVCNHKPEIALVMAVLRDAYMYREMSSALIMRYKVRVDDLEKRIDHLEELQDSAK